MVAMALLSVAAAMAMGEVVVVVRGLEGGSGGEFSKNLEKSNCFVISYNTSSSDV